MVRAMLEELRPIAADPRALLTYLNRDLTRILQHAGRLIFVAAAYAVVQLDLRRLQYAQAGQVTVPACFCVGGVKYRNPTRCPLDRAKGW